METVFMANEQLFFYLTLAILAFIYLRKQLRAKGLKNYSASEAKERMSNGSILLDVRTTRERNSQSVPASIHIPLHELSARMQELERYRSKEIICYCATGSRSVNAAYKLQKAGFRAANLKDGIRSWNFGQH
jgi:rhodanese-related sulfurtransferase